MEEITQRIIDLRQSNKAKPISFSAIAAAINDEFPGTEMTKDRAQKLFQRTATPERRKVIGVGDIHAAPDEALTAAILEEQADLIVIGGDLFDAHQFSSHPKYHDEPSPSIGDEILVCRKWLESLNTPKKVVTGNHDHRFFRLMAEALKIELKELFDLNMIRDPLVIVTESVDDCELVSEALEYQHPNGTKQGMGETRYMYRVGDALFSHANFTSKNPGMAVKKLYDWVGQWRRPLGWGELSLMVQFHGHKIAQTEMEGGHCILVEPGMGGNPASEAYKVGYEAKWSPASLGAVVFEQTLSGNDWKTDLASVRLIRPRR